MAELSRERPDLEDQVDRAIEHLWPEGRESGWTLESFAAMMRAAYGQGYVDSLASATPYSVDEALVRLEFLWKRLPTE